MQEGGRFHGPAAAVLEECLKLIFARLGPDPCVMYH